MSKTFTNFYTKSQNLLQKVLYLYQNTRQSGSAHENDGQAGIRIHLRNHPESVQQQPHRRRSPRTYKGNVYPIKKRPGALRAFSLSIITIFRATPRQYMTRKPFEPTYIDLVCRIEPHSVYSYIHGQRVTYITGMHITASNVFYRPTDFVKISF